MSLLKFSVFGNPIKQSYSPKMHLLFAESCGLKNVEYTKTLVPLDAFPQTVHHFFQQGGHGLNVTVPFKLEAFELAKQHLTPRAQAAGAVNTLWYQDNLIHGDNTDGISLVKDILRQGISLKQKILLIGAGGAARGAILPLIQAGCTHLHIANRSPNKAADLADIFNTLIRQTETDLICKITSSDLNNIVGEWDIIINASSSSLGGEPLNIADNVIAHCQFAYDMLYTATGITPFLQQALEHGVKHYSDGLGMLVYQGAEAFAIWTKKYPNPEPVIDILRQEIAQNH
ncbi:shikimate 5-dehydrogenase [Pelistega indica]|uniref:Shikimate dehydrogenase (NADP(+)) n=1 Tax=Pelistega indica TaxID=1414851 RepID=V8G6J5_9BURK|nr:shikimate dehydrogenase [Pelistega indica]ETD72159.1 shikimate 5-dehydrogenase [Pelistega indica]